MVKFNAWGPVAHPSSRSSVLECCRPPSRTLSIPFPGLLPSTGCLGARVVCVLSFLAPQGAFCCFPSSASRLGRTAQSWEGACQNTPAGSAALSCRGGPGAEASCPGVPAAFLPRARSASEREGAGAPACGHGNHAAAAGAACLFSVSCVQTLAREAPDSCQKLRCQHGGNTVVDLGIPELPPTT